MTEKTQFRGFMFPHQCKDTIVRRGGITNHRLIAYSLRNISAKIIKIGWSALKLYSSVLHQCLFEIQCTIRRYSSEYSYYTRIHVSKKLSALRGFTHDPLTRIVLLRVRWGLPTQTATLIISSLCTLAMYAHNICYGLLLHAVCRLRPVFR